jgi:hypothetical protein
MQITELDPTRWPSFHHVVDGGTTMSNARHIGRVGALAAALRVGNFRAVATRATVSIGVAAVVAAATVVPGPVSTVSPVVRLSADSTALIVCGATCPTPDEFIVESAMDQFITPTHPGQNITPVAVTTPSEFWPVAGLLRLVCVVTGDPRIFGPGGAARPDEPWWKLSGLFDLTADQSLNAGVADLEAAMAAHGNEHLVIFGDSLGAGTVNVEKKRLAEQYPSGTTAPDISFVLIGDPNVPNGGLMSRFSGLYIPILDVTFNGPESTDTQFHTDVINRQYDGAADFPLYPLNVIADLNALLGFLYVHTNPFDVSLPADPTTSPAYQGTHGDSSYYLFPTQDLPLFAPLRTLGVPESLIDVVEPFFRVLVDLGYDRSIRPWEPTPARLIPPLNPGKVIADLVNAIGEGINNASALVGLAPVLSIPAPVTLAAPATETAKAAISPRVTATDSLTQTQQVIVDGNGDPNPAVDVDRHGDRTQHVTSTDTPTRTQQVSLAPAGASESSTTATPEPSASASTPKPPKHAGQPAKPRPVVRDALGLGQQLPDRSHRGEAEQPTTRTAAAGAGAATAGPSSVASSSVASSSKGSNSSGGDSSGGDADGS